MSDGFIIDAVRTPRGKRKGSLAGIHAVDLAAHAPERRARAHRSASASGCEDVVLGCVTQIGEQAFDVARGSRARRGPADRRPGQDGEPPLRKRPHRGRRRRERHPRRADSARHRRRRRVDDPHPDGLGRRHSATGPPRPVSPSAFPDLHHQGLSARAHRAPVVPLPGTAGRVRRGLAGQGRCRACAAAGSARRSSPSPCRTPTAAPGSSPTDEHPRPGTTVETSPRSSPASARTASSTPATPRASSDGAAAVRRRLARGGPRARAHGRGRASSATAVVGSDRS
jgi:hypothetical protein